MSTNKINFERSSQSNIKGFKDLDLFDDFIQSALDKYNFTPEIPKLDESAEKFHDYILNEESQIPDLIIYNKTFNKNDCFSGKFYFGFNKFPRKKFVLNAQNSKKDRENNNLEEKTNNNTEDMINVANKEGNESMKDNKDNDNKKDKNIQENEVKNEITNSMENNEYEEVNHIVKALDTMIDHMSTAIVEIPDLVLLSKKIIPKRVEEILDSYEKMTKGGYNIEYLIVCLNLRLY